MLLSPLSSVEPGMVLAASVAHPSRPDRELLRAGVTLDTTMIRRLERMGVRSIWVNHDALADLSHLDLSRVSEARARILNRLRDDFRELANQTVSTAQVLTYKQAVMDLICELIAGRGTCGLVEQMMAGPKGLFTHGVNVAYLALIAGLELETYIVRERPKLAQDRARDLTSLGVGCMLHDIGKLHLPKRLRAHALIDRWPDSETAEQDERAYLGHAVAGYRMLRVTATMASAKQIVLNHHQRWDGEGFPDMKQVTNGRRAGPQAGKQIHVLTRIAAAANVLDNLLSRARESKRPEVAAMRELTGSRFEGYFDPIVRDAVLRCLPPFPVGATVRLNDRRAAAVVTPNLRQPCRPTVRLLDPDAEGAYRTIDLHGRDELQIVECNGQSTAGHLFELEDRMPLARSQEKRSA